MKKIEINTTYKKLLADVFTPVGIYLRLRDRFRDTILLESTDFHAGDNSYSFIGINAIAGIEIINLSEIEFKLPAQKEERVKLENVSDAPKIIWEFMNRFNVNSNIGKPANAAQGLFGYTTFDAVQFFDTIHLAGNGRQVSAIPLMRYRLYQYVIAVNHFKDELYICENRVEGLDSEADVIENLIRSKDVPEFPFKVKGDESTNMKDADYIEMVKKGIQSCHRGD